MPAIPRVTAIQPPLCQVLAALTALAALYPDTYRVLLITAIYRSGADAPGIP